MSQNGGKFNRAPKRYPARELSRVEPETTVVSNGAVGTCKRGPGEMASQRTLVAGPPR
jgi:hypothetical protein